MIHRSKQYLIDDLSIHESWRLFKIMSEIVDGFENLSEIGPAVSMFGSARVKPEEPLYQTTVALPRPCPIPAIPSSQAAAQGLWKRATKAPMKTAANPSACISTYPWSNTTTRS